jgi:predicted secreted protein
MSATKFKGKGIYLQVSTDGTTWNTLAALQKKSFKVDNEEIDTTNDTTGGSLKELSPGLQNLSLDFEGFSYTSAAPTGYSSYNEMLTLTGAQTVVSIRLVDNISAPVNRNMTGTGFFKSLEEMYETNKYTEFKGSFAFQTISTY